MIVKFLPTYTGGGLGSIDYLLNERTQQGTARILKGNQEQTRAIINQMTFKQKTCFGVLSFSERADSISDKVKQEIIADFERTLLGDYMKERVNILWVEHSDKNGRLELNFLIPKIDLITGKSFNPYFAKNDQFNIDLWKRTINDEYGFTSPNDPARKSNIGIDKKDIEHYNTITELDNALKQLVSQGVIKNRSHMIELLENNGYTVSRQNKTGISIILPNQKRPNRMKGGIYNADFTDLAGLGKLGESESRRIQQYVNRDTQAECLLNRNRIERNIQKRDERNKKRYNEPANRSYERSNSYEKREITKNYNWQSVNSYISRIFHRNGTFLLSLQLNNSRVENLASPKSNEIYNSRQKWEDTTIYSSKIFGSDRWQRWQKPILSYKITWNTKAEDEIVRDRIMQRNRELAERARKIAERNREITERAREHSKREQDFKRELREFAKEQNDITLQRLNDEIQERFREHIDSRQKTIRGLNNNINRNNEYKERIEPNINELQEQFSSTRTTIKDRLAKRVASFKRTYKKASIIIEQTIRNKAREFTTGLQHTFDKLRKFAAIISGSRERINQTKSEVDQLNEYRKRKLEQEASESFEMGM